MNETIIRNAIAEDVYYMERNIGRIIHYSGFSVVRYDGSSLRSEFTDWIVFINGEDVNNFETLREAKEYGIKVAA